MSSRGDYRRGRQEEPDWRTRENRGHSWFTSMKREKDKKKTGRSKQMGNSWLAVMFCQRCHSHDHFTYQCKSERIYQTRPSVTQQASVEGVCDSLVEASEFDSQFDAGRTS